MALDAGTKAPDFELPSGGPDDTVRLSDLRGNRVVLLFFPMAFTGVCTEEMCSVTDDLSSYEELEARVFGISVDSPFSQNAWKQEEEIAIPLLSDFNREAVTAYDVKRDDLLGLHDVANRAAFVIDGDGVIRYSWETEDPTVLPDFDEIKAVLRDGS